MSALALVVTSAAGVLAGAGPASADEVPGRSPGSTYVIPDHDADLPPGATPRADAPTAGRAAMRDHQEVRVAPAHDFRAFDNLDTATIGCSPSASGDPIPLARRGGTRGTHAMGWSFENAVDQSAGVQTQLTDPAYLLWLDTQFLAPNGGGAGYVFARVYDDAAPNGYWFGYNTWSNTGGTGWQALRLADTVMSWSYVENGTSTYVRDDTISDFAGPDSRAWVGITAGCDGATVYFDEFNAGDLDSDITWDFEGLPSQTWSWRDNAAGDALVPFTRNTTSTISYGAQRWIAGDSWWQDLIGDLDDIPLVGTARLFRKAYGSSSFRQVSTGAFDVQDVAWFKLSPTRRTTYQIRFAGDEVYEASRAYTQTYNVRRWLSARVEDKSLFTGQSLVVRGTLRPADRGIKLSLQRRVDGRWKTLRTGTSGSGGDYRLPFTVKSVGEWRVRVLASSGKGVLSSVSPTRVITVKRRPVKVVSEPKEPEGGTTYTPPPPAPEPTVDTRPTLP